MAAGDREAVPGDNRRFVKRSAPNAPRFELGWFHRYPARFAPSALDLMFAGLENRLTAPPKSLLDPFMGTGAALAAAVQLGINAVGFDRFALGVLIARLRLEPPADLEDAVSAVNMLADMKVPRSGHSDPELVQWVGADNARLLTAYRDAIADVRDIRLKRFLQVSISSALRASSRWLAGSIKAQIDPDRSPSDIRLQIKRTARSLRKDCQIEQHRTNAVATARMGDARKLDAVATGSIDALLTSPPYWTTYDYLSTQRLTYIAFQWPAPSRHQIGRRYGISPDGRGFAAPSSLASWYVDFGEERTSMGRALREYVQRIREHLLEAYRVLKPDGVAAYAIANSVRREKTFDLVGAFSELAEEAGFVEPEVVARTISTRRILPAGRDVLTGRFSSDFQPAISEQALYLRRPKES